MSKRKSEPAESNTSEKKKEPRRQSDDDNLVEKDPGRWCYLQCCNSSYSEGIVSQVSIVFEQRCHISLKVREMFGYFQGA